jgi:transposase-like protein
MRSRPDSSRCARPFRRRFGRLACVEQYENNRIEADHVRLKHRLRPMRGLLTDRAAQVVIAGLAFIQNLRRSHYEIATEASRQFRVAGAFTELALAI